MTSTRPQAPLLALLLGGLVLPWSATSCAQPAASPAAAPERGGLAAFADEAAFERVLADWAKRAEREEAAQRSRTFDGSAPLPAPMAASAEASAAMAGSQSLDSVVVTGTGINASESITNVQTAGVDEGGIVKRHGEHLVVLRRGRLFTIRIGDDRLQPVASIDAFGPGTDPDDAWYDEMLVAGDTVVVIGYSYANGATELVLFDIAADGGMRHRDTWHLRSNDYYSARNSASRLVGDTLVFYTPLVIRPWALDRRDFIPAVRRWRPGVDDPGAAGFTPTLPATRIHHAEVLPDPFAGEVALHTVTRCDLAARVPACSSIAVLGPAGRVFYVFADSVFVWTADRASPARATVFRIPLDATTPTALNARGVPIDQMSFLHDRDGHLNVLLSDTGDGEGMWGSEASQGGLALLRIALDAFGDGSRDAPAAAYRRLPGTTDDGDMQNRFVGDWLLYGSAPWRWRQSGDRPAASRAHALRFAARDPVQPLAIGHGTERIEAMGTDAILVGSANDDLQFTSVRLDGARAAAGSVYVQPGAAQGESRSHGFFYRRDGERDGIVGLPIVAQRRDNTMQRYLDESASVLYLRNHDLRLAPLGQLVADADGAVDDGCRASCVDWYGNARPIFIGDRVFALLGYELVEGRIAAGRVSERRRANFAPGVAVAD